MSSAAFKEPVQRSEPSAVTVSVEPSKDAGAGVYVVSVKVDNHAAGTSVVRTSPREFAFQHLTSDK